MSDTAPSSASGPWRQRGRRVATGVHVLAAAVLAAALAGMLNLLAARYYVRLDVSMDKVHALSERSLSVLAGINADIDIDVVYEPSHASFADIRALLAEYAYAARHVPSSVSFSIRYVDPDRDLGRLKELRDRFDLEERDVIVVSSGGRRKVIPDADLYETMPLVEERVAFNGEAALSAALYGLTQERTPVVGVLKGHGERDPWSFHEFDGYSRIARVMAGDNLVVQPVVIGLSQGIPADCDALLIAGPTRPWTEDEVAILRAYLEKSGRALILLDPFVKTGLEPLLETWGVRVEDDLVVDMVSLNSGREFYVGTFSDHPVTARLRNMTVLFSGPRSVEPIAPAGAGAGAARSDKPRVTPLALTSSQSWAKRDPASRPMGFDRQLDRRGPIGLAVAVERGDVAAGDAQIDPTRLVVIGDSGIVANGALARGAAGNADFYMSALDWILSREALIGIAPRPVGARRYILDRDEFQRLALVLVGGLPGAAGLLGVLIWICRRR